MNNGQVLHITQTQIKDATKEEMYNQVLRITFVALSLGRGGHDWKTKKGPKLSQGITILQTYSRKHLPQEKRNSILAKPWAAIWHKQMQLTNQNEPWLVPLNPPLLRIKHRAVRMALSWMLGIRWPCSTVVLVTLANKQLSHNSFIVSCGWFFCFYPVHYALVV